MVKILAEENEKAARENRVAEERAARAAGAKSGVKSSAEQDRLDRINMGEEGYRAYQATKGGFDA